MQCPECGRNVKDPAQPYRPFCSQRCKLLDLNKWISGEYRIASVAEDESDCEATEAERPEEA